jgi:hypothetical protein
MVLFEPGDVWICDGRTVPHQVVYGRRVVSSFYRLDSARLPAWHPSLARTVKRVHDARAAGLPAPAPAHSMRGYAYPFAFGGPKPPPGTRRFDLKSEWDKLYQENRQPRLVRL